MLIDILHSVTHNCYNGHTVVHVKLSMMCLILVIMSQSVSVYISFLMQSSSPSATQIFHATAGWNIHEVRREFDYVMYLNQKLFIHVTCNFCKFKQHMMKIVN